MSALLSALLLAAPTAPPPRFDLECAGGRAWAAGGEVSRIVARYRVDTLAGRWCRDECATSETVMLASGGKLIFKQRDAASGDRYSETVDLATGAWRDHFEGEYPPGDYWDTQGTCTLAPFTTLPSG